jgi:hypothetical protein
MRLPESSLCVIVAVSTCMLARKGCADTLGKGAFDDDKAVVE